MGSWWWRSWRDYDAYLLPKENICFYLGKKNWHFFVDLLSRGKTFDSKYFISSIIPQKNILAYQNGYTQGNKKCLLHYNNAPAHKSTTTKNELAKYPFKLIPNPLYSPDISPLDFSILETVEDRMPYESIDSEDELKEIIEPTTKDHKPVETIGELDYNISDDEGVKLPVSYFSAKNKTKLETLLYNITRLINSKDTSDIIFTFEGANERKLKQLFPRSAIILSFIS